MTPRSPGLSIGAVSRATGIPVETLRTWEQRYGFPVPERRPSGHRVYSPSIVPRLRRISEALACGCRPGEAVHATDAELSDLLTAAAPADTARGPGTSGPAPLDDILEAASAFDGERLTRLLLQDWASLDPLAFLERRVGPLVQAMGERWSRGELQIRHEHFLSERLGDLLRLLRGPFEARAAGPPVVLATLPGEQHALGLQMAALVIAATGSRVVYLGTDTPVDQIVDVALDTRARAVAVSVSAAASLPEAARTLEDLRARLPAGIVMCVGGAGATAAPDRVVRVQSFRELSDLVQGLRIT